MSQGSLSRIQMILDITVPRTEPDSFTVLRTQVLPSVKPNWKQEDVRFSMITSGYVNIMMVCYLEEDVEKTDAVTVRIYGEQGPGHESRDLEFVKMQIGYHAGCFVQPLATFKNGVIYGYVPGRCLKGHEVMDPTIVGAMIKRLAGFHYIDTATLELVDRQGEKFNFKIDSNYYMLQLKHRLDAIANMNGKDAEERKKNDAFFQECEREVAFVERYLHDFHLPMANCHGDWHSNNMLYDEKTGDIKFVDYEFSGYGNFAMSDFAYILNGHRFIAIAERLDLTYEAPSNELLKSWISVYLREKHRIQGDEVTEPSTHEVELWLVQLKIMFALHWLYTAETFYCLDREVEIDVDGLSRLSLTIYHENKPNLEALKARYLEMTSMQ